MPSGWTREWSQEDVSSLLVSGGHLPLAVTENKKFQSLCRKLLKTKSIDAVRTTRTLASNLYNNTCRSLLRTQLDSAWLQKVLTDAESPEVLDLCIVLSRQLPTALKTREVILSQNVYVQFKDTHPEQASLLKMYLDATDFDRDLDSEIEEFQSVAFDLGLQTLAELPKSAVSDPEQLEFYLSELDSDQLGALAAKLGLNASSKSVAARYTEIRPVELTAFLEPHPAVDTGVFVSIEDCINTQRIKVMNSLYEGAKKQVDRMHEKLETGTYRYGAPAQFKVARFVVPKISSVSLEAIYEVEIDPEDLSEQGKVEFARLSTQDYVLLTDKTKIWIGRMESTSPLTVRSIRRKAENIVIPLDQLLVQQLSYEISQDWPEFLVKPLLGWGYEPEPAKESNEFVERNDLAVIAVQPGGEMPELDFSHLGRTLVISRRAVVKGSVRIYREGDNALMTMERLLSEVEELANKHGLQAFYKNDWPTARYIAKRLGMLGEDLFVQLEWLAPLQILDASQHEHYLLRTADVIVLSEPVRGSFDTLVVDHAERWTELETLQMIDKALKKVVLIGEASPISSLFSRLVDYGVHFCQAPLDVSPRISALYSDWYPTLSAIGGDILPGFANIVQKVFVDGYGSAAYNEQHVGTAEYAVLLYQYLRLLGYKQEKIIIACETRGQSELVQEIAVARNCGDAPFCGEPAVFSLAYNAQVDVRDVIIYSAVREWNAPNELMGVFGKKGVFFLIPGSGESDLKVVVGELYDRVIESREATPLVGLKHLADYVKEMTKQRLQWKK